MGHVIILPTDGSATAKQAAAFAADMARADDDEVVVLAVAEPAVFVGAEDPGVSDAIVGYLETVVAEEADALRALGVNASTAVVRNTRVHEAIIEAAEMRGARAIVMGTHGRSGLARAVIGSVADRVVRESPIPVVLVPTVPQEVLK